MGPLLEIIGRELSAAEGRSLELRAAQAVGGGSIHRAYRVEDGERSWFVKLNDAKCADLFAAEADGLQALAAGPLRVPRVACAGTARGASFLVLEWLDFAAGTSAGFAKLGEGLALQHQIHGERHGWRRDNYIGATPQENASDDSWARFYGERRLAPQFALLARGGSSEFVEQGERLLAALPQLLAGHAPQPSLLHGDLWSGNAALLADGTPVIFDPAVHFGDRECDLAMTELFGGFPQSFYAAYRANAPLAPGYDTRKILYQLYHALNHANLFGGGYESQAARMIARLLAEVSG